MNILLFSSILLAQGNPAVDVSCLPTSRSIIVLKDSGVETEINLQDECAGKLEALACGAGKYILSTRRNSISSTVYLVNSYDKLVLLEIESGPIVYSQQQNGFFLTPMIAYQRRASVIFASTAEMCALDKYGKNRYAVFGHGGRDLEKDISFEHGSLLFKSNETAFRVPTDKKPNYFTALYPLNGNLLIIVCDAKKCKSSPLDSKPFLEAKAERTYLDSVISINGSKVKLERYSSMEKKSYYTLTGSIDSNLNIIFD